MSPRRSMIFFPELIIKALIAVALFSCPYLERGKSTRIDVFQNLAKCPLLNTAVLIVALDIYIYIYIYTAVEWTDCIQSDIRAFGIAGDWKATALKAEVWVETVTEGGRRFMAAWRKEEVDAARHRQEKREATRLGNLLSQTGV